MPFLKRLCMAIVLQILKKVSVFSLLSKAEANSTLMCIMVLCLSCTASSKKLHRFLVSAAIKCCYHRKTSEAILTSPVIYQRYLSSHLLFLEDTNSFFLFIARVEGQASLLIYAEVTELFRLVLGMFLLGPGLPTLEGFAHIVMLASLKKIEIPPAQWSSASKVSGVDTAVLPGESCWQINLLGSEPSVTTMAQNLLQLANFAPTLQSSAVVAALVLTLTVTVDRS